MTDVALAAEGIWMQFGPVEVFTGLDLSARPGEFLALVGPSGCGKSTLLQIIAGVERPQAGRVQIDGRETTGEPGYVGYMPQHDLLLPWRTVRANARLPLELAGQPRREADRRVSALLDRFGLSDFAGYYPHALSGGMRQRVAFLRAVAARRPLLLLDEPFGALDALTRQEMQEWLLAAWTEVKQTIVFVTHDVEEALFLADRIVVLSPRPAALVGEVAVELPRPRRPNIVTTPEFVALRSVVMKALVTS